MLCKGDGTPAVVIEPGAGEPAELWRPMQDTVATFARVCTYDRAGYGWSDPVLSSRTIEERVEDLRALLVNAAVPEPYILVGHSYGGVIVRWFAHRYPNQVAGLVLVDAAEEGTILQPDVLKFYSRLSVMCRVMRSIAYFGLPRLLRALFPKLRGVLFERPQEFAAAADDLASLRRANRSLKEPSGLGLLGNLPLVVVTHGQPFPGPFAVVENGWREGQKRLAALSSDSVLIVAQKSNHMIHLDEPNLVADAIRSVLNSALSGIPLNCPECSSPRNSH
jgi:pimeloyl-ACP methyl ester carboxylesterase